MSSQRPMAGPARLGSLGGLVGSKRHLDQQRRIRGAAAATQSHGQGGHRHGGNAEQSRPGAEGPRGARARPSAHQRGGVELLRHEHGVRVWLLLLAALACLVLQLGLALFDLRNEVHGAQGAWLALLQDELMRGFARDLRVRHGPSDARGARGVHILEIAICLARLLVLRAAGGCGRRCRGRNRRRRRRLRHRRCGGAPPLPVPAAPLLPIRCPCCPPHLVLRVAVIQRQRLHLELRLRRELRERCGHLRRGRRCDHGGEEQGAAGGNERGHRVFRCAGGGSRVAHATLP
mmetsp:Transcript_19036/g.54616  ORF Transcript_19036/g.54616 Transcript_19036/m.54616 type:complete len:290 (+) Transcript_19036:439-1308(+)